MARHEGERNGLQQTNLNLKEGIDELRQHCSAQEDQIADLEEKVYSRVESKKGLKRLSHG